MTHTLGTPISRLASLTRGKTPIGRLAFPGCQSLLLRKTNYENCDGADGGKKRKGAPQSGRSALTCSNLAARGFQGRNSSRKNEQTHFCLLVQHERRKIVARNMKGNMRNCRGDSIRAGLCADNFNNYLRSFLWRQYLSSGLISVISMPGLTRNLQLSSSCG